MFLCFDHEGRFALKTNIREPSLTCIEADIDVPERFKLEDGELVDMFPDLSDEQALQALNEQLSRHDELEAIRIREENPVSPGSRTVKVQSFRARFTLEEKVAIYIAAETDPAIRVFLDDIASATYVDLDFKDVQVALKHLEKSALIGEGRANQILEMHDDHRQVE